MRRTFWLLPAVALLLASPARTAPPAEETAADEKLLKEAKVGTDGAGLLDFLRKRIPGDEDQKKVAALIRKLGSDDFAAREAATKELTAVGPPALPLLRKAMTDPDAEVKRRARSCVDVIEKGHSPEVEAAVLRLLRARKPAGACAALLAYLPFAGEEAGDEALLTLLAIGVKDGKVDAAVAAALQDKALARRAAAALVVGRSGTAEQRQAVYKLLTDGDTTVRLRAAQGLIAGRDKKGVPALVALLAEGPVAVARQAEDVLGGLAGDKAPTVPLGKEEAERRKCREAWAGWWKANEAKLDLAKLDGGLPWLTPVHRARTVTVQFINSLIKSDLEAAKKATDAPFSIMGIQTFNTREELDKFLQDGFVRGNKGMKIEFTISGVATGQEFLKTPGGTTMKDFLAKLPGNEVRVVYVSAQEDGKKRTEKVAIVVRVGSGRARVVGLAPLDPVP